MNIVLTALIILFTISISFSGCDIGLSLNFKNNAFSFLTLHTFLLLVLSGATLIQFIRNRNKFTFPPLGFQFIAIVSLTMFSLLFHNLRTINGFALLLMLIEGALTYFIIYSYVDTKKKVRYIIYTLFLIFAFQGLYAFYQFARPEIMNNPKIVNMGKVFIARSCGLLGNAGVFGVFMSMIWPIAFSEVLFSKGSNFFERTIKIIILVLGTGGILVSLTRSAWIGVLISLFAIFIYGYSLKRLRKEFIIRFFLLILALLLISNLFFPIQLIKERFFASDMIRQLSFRWSLDKITFKMIRDYPLWGIGVGNFSVVSKLYAPRVIHLVHKEYLFWLVEYGLIGFLLFVWFIFSFIKISYRTVKICRETVLFPLATGINAMIWSILIVNLSGLAMSHISIFLLFCLLLGLDSSIINLNCARVELDK